MDLLEILSEYLPQNDVPELVLDFLPPEDVFQKLEESEYKNKMVKKYKTIYEIPYIGLRCTYFNGQLHSFGDEPSDVCTYNIVVGTDGIGYKKWHKFGKEHREGDKPAVIFNNGDKRWKLEGKFHRDDHYPAIIIKKSQTLLWFIKGERYYPDKRTIENVKKSERFKKDL